MDPGRYISLTEAAALFGVSTSQLRFLAQTGKLQAWKIARNWLTTREAVAEYLANTEFRSHDPWKNKRP